MIQVSWIVITGAGMFSPQPLHCTVKSQIRVWGSCHTDTVQAKTRRIFAQLLFSTPASRNSYKLNNLFILIGNIG